MDRITGLITHMRSGGSISKEDIEWIRINLRDPNNDNLHQFARGIGHATYPALPNDIKLVENILNRADDDYDMQGAVYALCSYWDLTPHYINSLLKYIELGQWEHFSSTAMAVFSAIGRYLYSHTDQEIAQKLFDNVKLDITLKSNNSDLYESIHLDCGIDAVMGSLYGTREAFLRRDEHTYPYEDLLDRYCERYKIQS